MNELAFEDAIESEAEARFKLTDHPAFDRRVVEARLQLANGATPAEVREKHGLFVLRAALGAM